MPTTPKGAAFLKVRWSTYLSQLLENHGATRTQVARALEVPVSRVTQWLDGKRLIQAETAFETGENLRDKLDWHTSGPEALYACGYFIELFHFLKHLSIDYAANGESLAVKYFCWLPGNFLPFEVAVWDKQFLAACDDHVIGDLFERNIRECSHLEVEIDLYYFHKGGGSTLRDGLTNTLRSPAIRGTIMRAWTGVQRGELRPTSAPSTTNTFTQEVLGEPIQISCTRSKLHLLDRENNGIVDAVIDVAHRFRGSIPSFTATRLWRLLGEWALYVDPNAFGEWNSLLPHTYKSWEPRDLSEDEVDHLRRLEYERDARRH